MHFCVERGNAARGPLVIKFNACNFFRAKKLQQKGNNRARVQYIMSKGPLMQNFLFRQKKLRKSYKKKEICPRA